MSRKYEEILKTMKDQFQAASGCEADDASDIGIRLKVLAGELYGIDKTLDWMEDQMYVDTATGEYLDKLALEHGLKRGNAVKAEGKLEFSRNEPLTYDIVIPSGTVCSLSDDADMEYITTERCVIGSNGLLASARAQAVVAGSQGNCAAKKVTALVTVPEGVEAVTNKAPFTGGCDAECDELFRSRILKSCSALPNGINAEYYRKAAMSFDGVTSAGVMAGSDGTVGVYLWGNGGPPSADVIKHVQTYLTYERELNSKVKVSAAAPEEITFSIFIKPKAGVDFITAKEAVTKCIQKEFASMQVGDPVYKAAIVSKILGFTPVENYNVPSGVIDVKAAANKIPVLSALSVLEMI